MFPLHDTIDQALRDELVAHDDLTAALLARRGIATKEDAERFLNPSYDEHLHDPLLMTDMEKAARRFADAILAGEHIAVWSDYDADGIPGGALLHDFLQKAGADFENYIPHRHLEGYGMNESGIEALAARGTKLIITVDSGITDLAPVARAKELGMNVIVTDHHLPGETLPDAFAVVNPNARPVRDKTSETSGSPGASVSNGASSYESYPFHELCGAGVAWKLVVATLAVEPALREKVPEGWEKWLLDLVGIATVADMVSLTGENRVLATYGLIVLRKSPRLGLQKLMRAMRTDQRTVSEDDIGFMIAPRINAASRMGDAHDAFRLLTTTDENEADELAKKLEKLNRQRKAEAGAITRAVHARLKDRDAIPEVIALGDPEWRPALLGLVAGNIADEFERPVFLWGREGSGVLKGSMRSGGVVHGLELMRAAEDTFEECGGHAAAGGFTVKDTAIFDLEERLARAYASMPVSDEDDFAVRADAELELVEATKSFLSKIERLAPFGMENPKPIFLFRNVQVANVSRFGKNGEHVKAVLTTDRERPAQMDAVTFFAKGHITRVTDTHEPGARVHVLAHLERDTFSRGTPIRLRLIDIRTAR